MMPFGGTRPKDRRSRMFARDDRCGRRARFEASADGTVPPRRFPRGAWQLDATRDGFLPQALYTMGLATQRPDADDYRRTGPGPVSCRAPSQQMLEPAQPIAVCILQSTGPIGMRSQVAGRGGAGDGGDAPPSCRTGHGSIPLHGRAPGREAHGTPIGHRPHALAGMSPLSGPCFLQCH